MIQEKIYEYWFRNKEYKLILGYKKSTSKAKVIKGLKDIFTRNLKVVEIKKTDIKYNYASYLAD